MSDEWKVEHDLGQYRLMLDHLTAYREKKLGIHALLSALKGLLTALESKNGDWFEEAISERANLEILYAVECDRCEEAGCGFDAVDKVLFELASVKRSIQNIELIARERLGALS